MRVGEEAMREGEKEYEIEIKRDKKYIEMVCVRESERGRDRQTERERGQSKKEEENLV